VEKFNFTYAGDISSFKISVPNELFLTMCCRHLAGPYDGKGI